MTTHPPTETVSDCCGAKVSWENRKKDGILVEISYAICQKCHKDCKAVFRKNEDRIEAITRGIDRFLPMAMNPKATDDEWLNNWSSLKKYVAEAMREVTTKVEPTVEKWERELSEILSHIDHMETHGLPDEKGRYIEEKLKDLLSHSLQQAREEIMDDVMRVVDRHVAWKPTCGYGSEEELGYQKGLIAEAKLMKKDLSDLLTKEEKVREYLQHAFARHIQHGMDDIKKNPKWKLNNKCTDWAIGELDKAMEVVAHSVQEAKAEERGIVTDIIKKWVMKTGVTARITTPDTEVVNATELHKLLHSLNVKASLKQEEEKV